MFLDFRTASRGAIGMSLMRDQNHRARGRFSRLDTATYHVALLKAGVYTESVQMRHTKIC